MITVKLNNSSNKNKNKFLKKLFEVEKYITDRNKGKNESNYILNNYLWTNELYELIKKHKKMPDKNFVNMILNYNIVVQNIVKINGDKIADKYVLINKNQILIIDALLEHGGYTRKYFDLTGKNEIRYTEHAGYLALSKDLSSLSKIIVYGNTTRVDSKDQEIFLPNEDSSSFEYEYLFHTHPPTPEPGKRVVHEVPSVGDILHFTWHFNEGKTIGSLVMTSEGLYNIRKNDFSTSRIKIDENKFYKSCLKIISEIHNKDSKTYGNKFDREYFYSVIAQDLEFINKYNDFLHTFNFHIDYFPRKKNSDGFWYVDDVYLPIVG